MREQYQIDLEKYSLDKFKNDLNAREMIPSRVSLKDELDERFGILEASGIKNLRELIGVLKTKQKSIAILGLSFKRILMTSGKVQLSLWWKL